jgi:rhomboid family GlyGly-CTERM serine protease
VHRFPVATLFLAGAMGLAHWRGFDAGLTRSGVADGEPWRVLTGHFVHFGRAHFVGDVAAFAAWAAVVELWSRKLLLTTVAVTAALASAWVLVACPEVREYRGVSAIDCALAVQILLVHGRDRWTVGDRTGALLFGVCLIAFSAKTLYELATGHAILAPDLGSGVRLLPSVHVIGALTACVLVLRFPGSHPWRRHVSSRSVRK